MVALAGTGDVVEADGCTSAGAGAGVAIGMSFESGAGTVEASAWSAPPAVLACRSACVEAGCGAAAGGSAGLEAVVVEEELVACLAAAAEGLAMVDASSLSDGADADCTCKVPEG